MTNQTTVATSGVRTASSPDAIGRWQLGWRAVGTIAALAAIGIGLYFRRYEGTGPHLLYVWSATLFVAAAIVAITRRALVATILVTAMITIVVYASAAKHKAMDMVVHAYDIVFYMTSPSTLVFLWSEYRVQMVQLAAALFAFVSSIVLAYRLDGTRTSRWIAIPAMFAFAVLTGTAAIMKGERRHTQQYWDDLVVSTFYSSWPETIETLWRGQLIEAANAASGLPFSIPVSCEAKEKPPHVILIHQESIVPPEYFPQVSYDRRIDPMFRSGDDRLHRMRVETYGGASWLTEFSILAGVSTYSFGGMRPFVQSLMAGKVHDTLPQSMARCGYRNTVFYPLNRNFVSNAKFYTASGMPEIFDMKDQGAKTGNERDHFYYGNMLKLLDSHIKTSKQPLFSYIITMSGHGPYLKPYFPDVDVPGGGPGTEPEMHEYLRRLSMARMDLEALKADLKTRFPAEKFLLVHYGDHQPIATRSYLGFGGAKAAEDVALTKDSPGFITYYAMEGINYTMPPLPDLETMDVPYLGTVMMEAAGLPLSPAHAERKRLMTLCGGRYDGCSPRAPILAFHRRLINSGLLQAR